MNPREFCRLAGRLMRHPVAPYYEHAVSGEVQQICGENRLHCEKDPFGNLLVRTWERRRLAGPLRPIVFAAHMDHPGFEIVRPDSSGHLRVRFQGGVPDQYFRRGLAVQLMPGNDRAKLGRRVGKERIFELQSLESSSTNAAFAVWDLEDFNVRGGQIHGRACDDLVGVAAALAAVIQLKKSRSRVHAMAAISRAEEVGFHGALALCNSRLLSKDSLVISLETSRELPGVIMGQGVILRVGDRTSVFDAEASRFLSETATQLRAKRKGFQFQRALMSGGTCEATAYQEYGFQTGAVCVALGNYHNCAGRNRIAAEYVSIADASSMVDLLFEAARNLSRFDNFTQRLPRRLESMRRQAVRKLRASA